MVSGVYEYRELSEERGRTHATLIAMPFGLDVVRQGRFSWQEAATATWCDRINCRRYTINTQLASIISHAPFSLLSTRTSLESVRELSRPSRHLRNTRISSDLIIDFRQFLLSHSAITLINFQVKVKLCCGVCHLSPRHALVSPPWCMAGQSSGATSQLQWGAL